MNFAEEENASSQKYLNLLGLFEGPDESKEREEKYNEAKNRWPIDEKISSCEHLLSTAKNIQLAIDAAMQTRALNDSKGNQRVQNRYIDAYTWYKNDVMSMYNAKNCDKVIEDQEAKEFFDSQYTNLERVKGLSDDTGSKTKYVILGMLGLVVVVSGIIIFKN